MDFEKSLSHANSGRRSFLWKAGAAVSAAVAAAVPGMASNRHKGASIADADRLALQLGILEDEKAIRTLHRGYEASLDEGLYEEAAAFFAEDAEVVFNGGVFKGRSAGIARLYCELFRQGLTGKKLGPAPDPEAGMAPRQETMTVAADRMSARAQFPFSIQVGNPLPDAPLVRMARLQGGGIQKWCESGVYEISYVKSATDGTWKIQRLEHRVTSQTDYRPGKSTSMAISVLPFARTYPADPVGPDRLV